MIPTVTEVRVTARVSVRSPFVAADLSPVATTAIELDKGKAGWTDTDVKVPDVTGDHRPKGLDKRELRAMSAGKPIRRQVKQVRHVVNTTGPSAAYREMQRKAAELAARG